MATHRDDVTDLGFLSHFEELRTRLLRALAALAVGVVAGWLLYPTTYRLVTAPIMDEVQRRGGRIISGHPAEALFAQMEFSVVLGLVLASPFIFYQLWAFIRPALTAREVRLTRPLLPAMSMLFIAGAGLAYYMLPAVIVFFLGFNPPGVDAFVNFKTALEYPLKMMLAFGAAFQLPVVLLALVWLGVLTPAILLKQWRVAVVVIFVVAAIATPTPDPMNMSILALPLLILYFGTVLVAYRFTKRDSTPAEEGGA